MRSVRHSSAKPVEDQPLAVAFVSLGCPKNLVDSEKMLGLLAERGAVPTADAASADVVVINTCGFIAPATRESLDAIAQAARLKRHGRVRRVVVAGCLATRMGRTILDKVPGVDAILGVADRDRIADVVLGTASPDGNAAPQRRWRADMADDTGRLRLTPRHYAYLRISDGCSRGCSFCTIPSIRGPLRSKPIEQVLAEAAELIADGAVELNIIGQDTTSYGRDLGPGAPDLAALLRRLDRLPGVRWLRLLYAYPSDFGDDVIDAIASARHVLPYIDLPLQHISDRILRLMRRRVTRAQTETLLGKLRSRIPGLTLRTTFIAGFPGETAAEHRELLDFVRDFGFDMLGVFSYSPEASTPASRLPDPVPKALRDARRAELMTAQQDVVFRRNADLIGSTMPMLIDRSGNDGLWVARSPGQAPDVDSVTLVRPGRPGAVQPGRIVPARITGYRAYDRLAECALERAS